MGDGTFVESSEAALSSDSSGGGAVGLVLDKTSYYAESGGQIYDTGVLRTEDGAEFPVRSTQSAGGYIVHIGEMSTLPAVKVGDSVSVSLYGWMGVYIYICVCVCLIRIHC